MPPGLAGKNVAAALAAVLGSLRRDLREQLVPELASDGARTTAALMDEMLGWVAVGLAQGDRLAGPAACDPAATAGYDAGSELWGSDAFAGTAAGLARQARTGNAAQRRDAVAAEAARLAAEDAAAADLAGDTAPLETPVTLDALNRWFAARLPAAGPVVAAERVVGGYSKDTWLLEIAGRLEGTSHLVLRRDLPFGPGENSVTEEHDVLAGLHAAGVAVPRPLAVEPDAGMLGTPFLLFPRLPGRAVFGPWHADPAAQQAVIRQVAACMARFHSLDPATLGLPAQARAEAVAAQVRLWRDKWQRRRLYPSAVLEAAFDWLENNVPAGAGPARLVHGDVSFRNTLIEDGRLVALLDWEFHHLGDPAEDLSYFRLVAEPHADWGMVMRAYAEAGGEPYDAARGRFWDIWRSTRNAVTTTTAWHGFVRGHYPASKAAYQGLSLYRFFLRDIADKLKEVL